MEAMKPEADGAVAFAVPGPVLKLLHEENKAEEKDGSGRAGLHRDDNL